MTEPPASSRSARVVVDAPTERRNPATLDIDQLATVDVLRRLNAEDEAVPAAVARVLEPLARVVDAAVERYERGGCVHYFGAGTAGRLGLLDAAELPATFSVPPGRVAAHHAGGLEAALKGTDRLEDDGELGYADAGGVRADDVAIGLSASGRTPYVEGALRRAAEAGAFRALVSANPGAALAHLADVHIAVDTGPEAIAGSTRLKAGTAQKLVLHGFSTALMVRLGRTYSNLMVEVAPDNDKLRGRAVALLAEASGAGRERCAGALAEAEGDTKVALVALLRGASVVEARALLERAHGRVRDALAHP